MNGLNELLNISNILGEAYVEERIFCIRSGRGSLALSAMEDIGEALDRDFGSGKLSERQDFPFFPISRV